MYIYIFNCVQDKGLGLRVKGLGILPWYDLLCTKDTLKHHECVDCSQVLILNSGHKTSVHTAALLDPS